MANKNVIFAHEIVDAEANINHGPLHPDPRIIMGSAADFSNLSMHLHPPCSGSPANHFMSYSSSDVFYANQYKTIQNHLSTANAEVGFVAPRTFMSNPQMASSSSQMPFTGQEVMTFRRDEYEGSNYFNDNGRIFSKRKNAEVVAGNFHHTNGASASGSSSSNTGLQLWNSVEPANNLPNAPHFLPPENQHSLMAVEDGYQQTVRSRPGTLSLQHESSIIQHQNHFLQGNYADQSFQSAINPWIDPYLSGIGDAGSNSWNYAHPTPALSGRSSNRGLIETGNFDSLGYQDSFSSRNVAGSFHNLSLPTHSHNLQPLQSLNCTNYHHHQVPAPPYGHRLTSNMYHIHGFPSAARDGMNSGLGLPRPLQSNVSEWIYGHHQCLNLAASGHNAVMDVVSPEILPFSNYGIEEELVDHHRDMRMDIDSMTYEELLHLQEQIGDVNTGLSEESVLKHLKIRLHMHPSLSLSILSPCHYFENGTCIICQVEFEENERIGKLDCGHDYHADCIKQWLLLKNLCPICKTTALALDKGGGEAP